MRPGSKFRVYLNGSMDGPFTATELCKLPNFSPNTLVCPEGEDCWIGAGQFPAITQLMTQVSSGDYKPEPLTPEELSNAAKLNWREAVIGAKIPDVKSYLPPLAPPPKLLSLTRAATQFGHRRKILLILLGFVSIGAYYPEADNLSAFLIELKTDDAAIFTMGSRFRQGGSPHAQESWKYRAPRKKSAAKVKNADSTDPSAQDIVEIGSEDVGNGLLFKTIVITEVHNGVRTQRTTTITVQSHPRKSKKTPAKKATSARLPPSFSGKIA
jgi:hypothetical protein